MAQFTLITIFTRYSGQSGRPPWFWFCKFLPAKRTSIFFPLSPSACWFFIWQCYERTYTSREHMLWFGTEFYIIVLYCLTLLGHDIFASCTLLIFSFFLFFFFFLFYIFCFPTAFSGWGLDCDGDQMWHIPTREEDHCLLFSLSASSLLLLWTSCTGQGSAKRSLRLPNQRERIIAGPFCRLFLC